MKFVLVHGAWWNGWAWEKVASLLEDAGHRAVVVGQLPSGGQSADGLGDLAADVAHVREIVDGLGGDVVLAGHSYGGIVITELAGHPGVRHSVYVSGFWPQPGQTLLDIRSEHTVEWVFPRDDGTLRVSDDPTVVRAVLARDLDDGEFAELYGRRLLQNAATFVAPATAPPRAHPATYVVCELDQGILPGNQRKMAAGADHVVSLDAAHFAPISRPREIADVLMSVKTAGELPARRRRCPPRGLWPAASNGASYPRG
jgi:pimeloyl-ACP methyl ester carboxylesterase